MTVLSFENSTPRIGERVWVAPTATVLGDVELADDVSTSLAISPTSKAPRRSRPRENDDS